MCPCTVLTFIVNECESDNGGCEGKCVDTLTLYECHCSDGYSLASDGFGCEGKYIVPTHHTLIYSSKICQCI